MNESRARATASSSAARPKWWLHEHRSRRPCGESRSPRREASLRIALPAASRSLRRVAIFGGSARAGFGGTYDGQGTNARTNRIAAQLSATVSEVLANGDLVISGWQALNISGERTNIRVSGRVRPEDISSDNAVLSSRLADARIEYDGKGFASRTARPGIVSRLFNWLGLL